jgi:hypothetical protein
MPYVLWAVLFSLVGIVGLTLTLKKQGRDKIFDKLIRMLDVATILFTVFLLIVAKQRVVLVHWLQE